MERPAFQIGDRIRLSELGKSRSKDPAKTGVVVGLPKPGSQCQVKWDGLKLPQMIHWTYLDLADRRSPDRKSGG